MSERYSKLFTLPPNLYSEGAPVVIAAGALLKDNETGKVLAQLKIQNISDKPIKAVTVKLAPGPISDFGGALVSVVVYLLTIRKILNKRSPAEPLPEV